jgi:uncharacterized protein YxjI
MAGILFNSNYESKSDEEIVNQLCKSWFSSSQSTADMLIGAKNEAAILNTFSKLTYVEGVFECGLFDDK